MKGKTNLIYKSIFLIVAILAASVFVALPLMQTKQKSYALTQAAVNASNDFSQIDSEGNIFSVEKVGVVSSTNTNENYNVEDTRIIQDFLDPLSGGDEKSVYTFQDKTDLSEKESYYFVNIPSETNPNKTVVKNNDFVMLENINTSGVYSSSDSSKLTTTSGTALQEAILVTFGVYDINGGINSGANKITNINISAQLNGNPFVYKEGHKYAGRSLLPGVRQYGENNEYQDFAYIIPQIPEFEGLWQFNIEYEFGGTQYVQNFSFYILFQSSYTIEEEIDTNNKYTAYPTFANATSDNFNLGYSSNYPTLTYDYTKYEMSYEHIANGVTTSNVYTFSTEDTASKTKGFLNCTSTSSGVTTKSSKEMSNYGVNASNANYVVFTFTEMGQYIFKFKYIYGGVVGDVAPEMNLSIADHSLSIYGFEAKYSKNGYEEAQMRHLTVADGNSGSVKADLIIPNGFRVDSDVAIPSYEEMPKLGTMYSLVTPETATKAGTVTATEDASVYLDNIFKTNNIFNAGTPTEYINKLTSVLLDVYKFLEYKNTSNGDSILENFISKDAYVKTNQGSIWLTSNDDYVLADADGIAEGSSFYYYKKDGVITLSDLFTTTGETTAKKLTNTTEFNKTGYYLVFVAVDVNGNNTFDTKDGGLDFYQVFAFQYTTDTVNISVETDDGDVVGAGRYTNKSITVSWEEPGIFDREITANYYYHQSHDQNVLLQQTPHELNSGDPIGGLDEVQDSSWATYLIEVKSEGKSTTYRKFTIDRQDISGVAVYAIEQRSANGANYYAFSTDKTGNYIKQNAISDSASTLYWQDKDSRANVSVTYSFTPFIKDTGINLDDTNNLIPKNDSDGVWFRTDYKLGNTATNLNLSKAPALGAEVSSTQMFAQQGIYVFTLKDDAGNECVYMFVIDKTESYFYLSNGSEDNKYVSGTSELFGSDVEYKVGTHKVIKLENVNSESLIYEAINNNLKNVQNYYYGDGNNISAISDLFASTGIDSDRQNFIIVKNNYVTSYTSENVEDTQTGLNSISASANFNNIYKQDDGGTSTIRKLYIVGENQLNTISNPTKSNSYIIVEINTDNSRGMVYSSNDKFTSAPEEESNGVIRIETKTNIENVHATSDNHVVFTWLVGADEFKVSNVSYTYYELDKTLGSYNNATEADGTNNIYFYKYSDTIPLFENDVYSAGAKTDDGKRAYAVINESNGATREGLYIITRTYASDLDSNSTDLKTLNYYFVVDRSGIIDTASGKHIAFELLENETEFKSFNQINSQLEKFSYPQDGINDLTYTIYLTTNKVPVTLQIPIGKFFNGTNSSNYYAGRLSFAVYYNDTAQQLTEKQEAYKLFEISTSDNYKSAYWKDSNNDGIYDYYSIDFTSALSGINANLQAMFNVWQETNTKSWLYLPGDYIIVISDTVEGSSGAHQQLVAFRVEHTKPVADIYVTTEKDSTTAIDQITNKTTIITTNQEFVKFELSDYDKTSTNALLDENYLLVTKKVGDVESEYINYPYKKEGGYDLHQNDYPIVYNEETKVRTIFLDTYTSVNSGVLQTANLITYTITVRYKLWTDEGYWEKYQNCYVDRSGKQYYEQTYTVIIDRVPSDLNTSTLVANDTLIKEYNAINGVSDTFENATYDSSGMLYFAKRYTAYYNGNQNTSELYSFKVNSETEYKVKQAGATDLEIVKVYSRKFANKDIITLKSLPITTSDGYDVVNIDKNQETYCYRDIATKGSGIYEIVEFDAAGNMTQYLIEYSDENSSSDVLISLNIQKTDGTQDSNAEIEDRIAFFKLNSAEITTTENFYIIEVSKGGDIVSTIYADLAKTTSKIAEQLVEAINDNGYGSYDVVLKYRSSENETYSYRLDYYNDQDVVQLTLENMVDKENWTINLKGANQTTEQGDYYLTSITISSVEGSTTYTSSDGESYKDSNGREVDPIISTTNDVVYVIQAIDSLGRTVSSYKFKSGDPDYVYYGISFGENGDANYIQQGIEYVAFQQVNIQFDTTAFGAVEVRYFINGVSQNSVTSGNASLTNKTIISIDSVAGNVKLYPYFAIDGTGALLEFEVNLYQYGTNIIEHTYKVVLDSRTSSVQLKDNTNGKLEDMQFDANVDILSTTSNNLSSGSKMLIWNSNTSDLFNYSYSLYETMNEQDENGNNIVVYKNLNEYDGYYSIVTGPQSYGEYRFVITILDKENNELGKKIYTFVVKAELNKVYYVQTEDGVNVEANSYFNANDIQNVVFNTAVDLTEITGTVPLFISNQALVVRHVGDSNITHITYTAEGGKFELHEIDAGTYKMFLGILIVTKTDGNLINKISIIESSTESGSTTTIWYKDQYPVSNEGTSVVGTNFALCIDSEEETDPILSKNLLIVDVKYGDELVESFFVKKGAKQTINLKGNGSYAFVVRDLAGNVQAFTTQYGVFGEVQATILREVEITINDMAPINKAYYNGIVKFNIVNRGNYEQGSIYWKATRNGEEYKSSSTTYGFEFSEYGTYRLVVEATPKGSTNGEILRKVLVFTIINEKEAKKSFDLTNLSGYEILEVLDNNDVDITTTFLNMLETSSSGMLVTYDMISNNEALNIGSGKQTFTLTYRVNDGLYPLRTVTFQFTMNNETPFIDCSLKAGEDTTKSFTIKFNPGIIYKQVGEAAIYVNGELLCEINESSTTELIKKKFSEKAYGAGDYYITLESLSGDMILAFKVEIKEPLNTSAIIIIVVVSILVIGVIVTIIVLRTKMRIR